jgi:hypothetical protein
LDFSLVLWLESEHSFTARKHAFGNQFRDWYFKRKLKKNPVAISVTT